MSNRTRNALCGTHYKRREVHSLRELLTLTEADLYGIRNFGPHSYRSLENGLAEHGLRIGMLHDTRPDSVEATLIRCAAQLRTIANALNAMAQGQTTDIAKLESLGISETEHEGDNE
jgi:hypothetical protein